MEGKKKICPGCGRELPEELHFCLYCMTPLKERDPSLPLRKKRKQKMILAVILLIIAVICAGSICFWRMWASGKEMDPAQQENIEEQEKEKVPKEPSEENKTTVSGSSKTDAEGVKAENDTGNVPMEREDTDVISEGNAAVPSEGNADVPSGGNTGVTSGGSTGVASEGNTSTASGGNADAASEGNTDASASGNIDIPAEEEPVIPDTAEENTDTPAKGENEENIPTDTESQEEAEEPSGNMEYLEIDWDAFVEQVKKGLEQKYPHLLIADSEDEYWNSTAPKYGENMNMPWGQDQTEWIYTEESGMDQPGVLDTKKDYIQFYYDEVIKNYSKVIDTVETNMENPASHVVAVLLDHYEYTESSGRVVYINFFY